MSRHDTGTVPEYAQHLERRLIADPQTPRPRQTPSTSVESPPDVIIGQAMQPCKLLNGQR